MAAYSSATGQLSGIDCRPPRARGPLCATRGPRLRRAPPSGTPTTPQIAHGPGKPLPQFRLDFGGPFCLSGVCGRRARGDLAAIRQGRQRKTTQCTGIWGTRLFLARLAAAPVPPSGLAFVRPIFTALYRASGRTRAFWRASRPEPVAIVALLLGVFSQTAPPGPVWVHEVASSNLVAPMRETHASAWVSFVFYGPQVRRANGSCWNGKHARGWSVVRHGNFRARASTRRGGPGRAASGGRNARCVRLRPG